MPLPQLVDFYLVFLDFSKRKILTCNFLADLLEKIFALLKKLPVFLISCRVELVNDHSLSVLVGKNASMMTTRSMARTTGALAGLPARTVKYIPKEAAKTANP